MFVKLWQNLSDSIMMKGKSTTGVNAEIIHIDLEPSFCNHIRENMIHKCLEGGRGVIETEKHDHRFIETKRSDKGCLPLIRLLNPNVVIPPTNVKLGEINKVLHIVNEF